MLYYEASGKRQRTCDFCIKNGGPPEECKANPADQKTMFELAKEEKRKADMKKMEEKGGASSYDAIMERNKHKRSDIADWCDWGVVPGAVPDLTLTANKNKKYEFTVFVPTDAQPGDTIEVTLPDEVNKVITYVEKSKIQNRQRISIGFGKDGVYYAIPPKGGHDMEAVSEAKKRKEASAAEVAGNALKTANAVMGAMGEAKDIAGMAGLKF
jgi:hypothetical protein